MKGVTHYNRYFLTKAGAKQFIAKAVGKGSITNFPGTKSAKSLMTPSGARVMGQGKNPH